MPLAPGQKLAAYEVLAPLGKGGMGEVWRAHDTRLGRDVAIKALPDEFARDPERLARLEREARILAGLSHPNIATIFGLEEAGGAPCLVLELVEGESLAQRLSRGPLSVRETLELGIQVASAIEAAHERGVVHRDLKPGNVMIGPSRTVKVLDFGLAKGSSPAQDDVATVAAPVTAAGLVVGTTAYMSPEQARGQEVDRRTDVWAFGCLLFEGLTGRRAFEGATATDTLARLLEREPEWNLLGSNVPARLREVVRRCLTKDAEERPRDIGDMRRELIGIERELSSPGSSSSSVRPTPSLAVLYFENAARDPESEYFCAGITEDILTDLSKIGGLRVASRNAVERFRGQAVDLARVGSDLGVGAILEGSVRRSGDRLRISAQLVNASDGFHLWAERYDRKLDDVFAVQEEIAAAIAQALKVALTPQDAERIASVKPHDARAYDLYLRGRALYAEYSEESLREALRLFEQAVAADPAYALAHAGIADVYGQMLQRGYGFAEEVVELGLAAARRAVALDPRLPEAHKALALVLSNSGDPAGARAALMAGLQADPRFGPILVNLCNMEFGNGNLAAAERYARRAVKADPQDGFGILWLAALCLDTGRPEEAAALADRVRKTGQNRFYTTGAHSVRLNAAMNRGETARVETLRAEALAEDADRGMADAFLAWALAVEGHTDRARKLLEQTVDPRTIGMGSRAAAAAAMLLGDRALAMRFFSPAAMRALGPMLVRLIPELHPLCDEPPYAPRRSELTLVWPLEAPMIDAARFRLFKEVRLESGLPEA